tara:strand:- start:129 stop:689 length:561 start_codon:yes stop_codon:yes gene_type:complete
MTWKDILKKERKNPQFVPYDDWGGGEWFVWDETHHYNERDFPNDPKRAEMETAIRMHNVKARKMAEEYLRPIYDKEESRQKKAHAARNFQQKLRDDGHRMHVDFDPEFDTNPNWPFEMGSGEEADSQERTKSGMLRRETKPLQKPGEVEAKIARREADTSGKFRQRDENRPGKRNRGSGRKEPFVR